MSLVLYGQSSTGKTTIASELARITGLPVRHCGDEVRNAARRLSIHVEAVSLATHREIDEQSRTWLLGSAPCIVEGRFLDHVLSSVTASSMVVQVVCSRAERIARWSKRTRQAFDEDALRLIDEADRKLIADLYADRHPLAPVLTLDTSSMSVAEAVELLERRRTEWWG